MNKNPRLRNVKMESVSEFLARGGNVTKCETAKNEFSPYTRTGVVEKRDVLPGDSKMGADKMFRGFVRRMQAPAKTGWRYAHGSELSGGKVRSLRRT